MNRNSLRFDARVTDRVRVDPTEYLEVHDADVRDTEFQSRGERVFLAFGSMFTRCTFRGLSLRQSGLGLPGRPTTFIDCTFDGLRVDSMGAPVGGFIDCRFNEVFLRDWRASRAHVRGNVFQGSIRKAVFDARVPDEDVPEIGLRRVEIDGNDFSGAELIDVSFRGGVPLDPGKLPAGVEYTFVPDLASGLSRAASWLAAAREADGPECRDGMILLRVWQEELESGQQSLLLHRPDYYRSFDRTLVDTIAALLAS